MTESPIDRTTTTPDNRVPADLDRRLVRLLETFVVRRGLHHARVAIATDDGQHWSAAVGPAGLSDPPPRPETPFFVASITKRFIVTLVLQAYERGELDIDAPITAYLPTETTAGLHVLDGVDRTAAITVRHLLSHTSGLPDYFEVRDGGPSLHQRLEAAEDAGWTFDDILRLTRANRPHFPPQDLAAPRQKARYCDTGFQLLIRILESVTGRRFSDLLTERIIDSLRLTQTWLPGHRPTATTAQRDRGRPRPHRVGQPGSRRHRRHDPRGPRAGAHVDDRRRALPGCARREPFPMYAKQRRVDLPSVIASSNDLVSTTGDLITFQRALLRGELFRDAKTVDLLTERRNRLRDIPVLQYGLGTMFFTVGRLMSAGRRPVILVGHSGSTGTWLFHCPERGLHLAGTVDQVKGQAIPFRLMARLLYTWPR
ncbi:beta-lactamase family protein [Mumia sp. zg.B21]|uniref:serine hydrolase domain-containing protein n=1 Tax=Mumia sp. zg.B21 TaxID=2855447 RepID=UPI001C6E72DB|nr:serine hydrolase domain-containing protein [Mumia sp. zg.B21]MBW9209075.1 beta-lactamase family protein [Mumia sp. zg.B21]